MNEVQIQRTRYILRARFRRAQTSPIELFASSCLQLIKWIKNHPILSPMCIPFNIKYSEIKDQIFKITEIDSINGYDPGCHKATNLTEHSALCYFVIDALSKTSTKRIDIQKFHFCCYHEFITGDSITAMTSENIDKSLETLKDIALDGLFEFFDEKIDDRNSIFGLLLKYKQLSEWFNRIELNQIAEDENSKGERALVVDLHKYIMNQGVEFIIEPSSVSGEVDLILKDPNGRYLILDAKYLKNTSTNSNIIKKFHDGFHQIMKYCEDYNETEGYLITYNNTDKRISLNIEKLDGINYFSLGGKTIYSIIINIKDEPTASKLGKGKELIIEESDLKITST